MENEKDVVSMIRNCSEPDAVEGIKIVTMACDAPSQEAFAKSTGSEEKISGRERICAGPCLIESPRAPGEDCRTGSTRYRRQVDAVRAGLDALGSRKKLLFRQRDVFIPFILDDEPDVDDPTIVKGTAPRQAEAHECVSVPGEGTRVRLSVPVEPRARSPPGKRELDEKGGAKGASASAAGECQTSISLITLHRSQAPIQPPKPLCNRRRLECSFWRGPTQALVGFSPLPTASATIDR